MEEIRNDTHVIDFIVTRAVRDSTAKEYKKRIAYYCDYLDKTPTMLIVEAETEEEANIRMKNRKIKKYLTNFLLH